MLHQKQAFSISGAFGMLMRRSTYERINYASTSLEWHEPFSYLSNRMLAVFVLDSRMLQRPQRGCEADMAKGENTKLLLVSCIYSGSRGTTRCLEAENEVFSTLLGKLRQSPSYLA